MLLAKGLGGGSSDPEESRASSPDGRPLLRVGTTRKELLLKKRLSVDEVAELFPDSDGDIFYAIELISLIIRERRAKGLWRLTHPSMMSSNGSATTAGSAAAAATADPAPGVLLVLGSSQPCPASVAASAAPNAEAIGTPSFSEFADDYTA